MSVCIEKADHRVISEKVNILLVDDRPENLLALEAVLTNPDYQLVHANSGEEALKHLLEQDFAVILLDVQMPGLNGFETADLIKKRKKTRHIPIIFITAINQSPEHVKHGYSVGAIDYIFTPLNPDILKMKVEGFTKMYQNQQQVKHQHQLLKQRNREIQKMHKQIEWERKQQYQRLEQLVMERTKELLLANEQLRQSEQCFRTVFQSSPCLLSIRSLKDGRYIDVSQSWLEHMGYEYDEVINQTSDLLRIFNLEAKVNNVRDLKDVKKNTKITFISKTGEKRRGLLSTKVIDIQNEECVLALILDITELSYLQEEIIRLDRLNLVGQMAAGIAHEIRNPMTTVKGFLQLMDHDSPSKYIDIMLKELDRANDIITEYLTLAKNKRSNRSLQGLNEIIKAIAPLVQAEAILSDKRVELQLGECSPIYIDEKEMRQLILNFVMNGLDAMSAGGTLTIRTYMENNEVVLCIEDEGTGIKEEELEEIWIPFFTTKETGTGLGLPICQSVAIRHQAVIDVESNEHGTAFYVRFKRHLQRVGG